MSLSELLIPTCRQMLTTLAGLLDKAREQMPGDAAEALLRARLAPDMFPLFTQICFAVVQAQEPAFRLRDEPVPQWLEAIAGEGRDADEKPGSMADAGARIGQALAFLDDIDAGAFDAGAERTIALALPNGMVFDMTGAQYARDWALPQFYFHVMTAYAILRSQGVGIGKADYVPHMFAYLRPGSLPDA